jgi:UTP--glucose-1-phosphate uridylyltransferase
MGTWANLTFHLFTHVLIYTSLCAAIERVLDQNSLNMEIIVNSKCLASGLNVIQLETAVGAAMKSFEGGLGK